MKRKMAQGKSSRTRGEKTTAGVDEFLLNGHVLKAIKRVPRDHEQVVIRRHELLLMAKNLPEATLGAVAFNSATNGSSGSNHAHARPDDGT